MHLPDDGIGTRCRVRYGVAPTIRQRLIATAVIRSCSCMLASPRRMARLSPWRAFISAKVPSQQTRRFFCIRGIEGVLPVPGEHAAPARGGYTISP